MSDFVGAVALRAGANAGKPHLAVGWLGVASDFVRAVALRGRGKHAQGVFGGLLVREENG